MSSNFFMNESLQKLITELAQRKGPLSSPILPDSNLRNDLHLDSLDMAVLAIRVQDAFNVDIFELPPFSTVSELSKHIDAVTK